MQGRDAVPTKRSVRLAKNMSGWHRYHLSDTLKALVTSETQRFFVQVREPPGEHREPITFYRATLTNAQEAADRIVQAYYPHQCDPEICDAWRRIEDE